MNDIRPIQPDERHFVEGIKQLVEEARLKSYAAINAVMLDTYWNIGRRIVEHEQQGKSRADYGARLLSLLADELTAIYGKGFSARNLRNFRQFYVLFPNKEIWHTRVPNLLVRKQDIELPEITKISG